jgi:hypothetical protein
MTRTWSGFFCPRRSLGRGSGVGREPLRGSRPQDRQTAAAACLVLRRYIQQPGRNSMSTGTYLRPATLLRNGSIYLITLPARTGDHTQGDGATPSS